MLFEVKDVDRQFYEDHLADFLPSKMVDIHTHVFLKSHYRPATQKSRGAKWPSKVAVDDSIEDLMETYRLMFPQQQVMPLIFTSPSTSIIFEEANGYVSRVASEQHLPSLIVNSPDWTAQELDKLVEDVAVSGERIQHELGFRPGFDLVTGWRETVRRIESNK